MSTYLTYIGPDTLKGNGWGKYRCICGKVVVVRDFDVIRKHTQSCGCFRNARLLEANTTHGLTGHPLHRTWFGIRSRCYDTTCEDYITWGGRGISMYLGWREDFKAFVDYLITLPNYGKVGYTLDRINNNGNYEPGNLRWATKKQQNRNRRDNVTLVYRGKKQCIAAWAEELGLNLGSVYARLRRYGNNPALVLHIGKFSKGRQ